MINLANIVSKWRRFLACGVVLCCCVPLNAAEIGKTLVARGAATAQTGSGPVRLLGRDSPLFEGDVISTGRSSFAIVRLADGSRLTLRPNTVLQLEAFSTIENEENSILRLFKGGLRAVSGFISKRNPSAFRLRTSVATIGIRGTTFDARLCEQDCADEAAAAKSGAAVPQRLVVGRVGVSHGTLTRLAPGGEQQPLQVGSAIYAGDTLNTAQRSFAVLAFRDKGRVTLAANTVFNIEQYRFQPDKPEQSSAVTRLLSGGLRAVSGLIGRGRPRAYQMRTSLATIGIRGTGYDLVCQDDCKAPQGAEFLAPELRDPLRTLWRALMRPAYAAGPTGAGLFADVWNGGIIVFDLPGGDLVINEGQVAFVPADGSAPVFLPSLPVELGAPRPDQVDIDHEQLFGSESLQGAPPGLYVSCYEGDCDVDDVNLGGGEAAHVSADGTLKVRLDLIPPFQANDPWLDEASLNLYSDLLHGFNDDGFECSLAN